MSQSKIPARIPYSGFFKNDLLCIYVSDQGDITMDRYDRKHRASLCWSGSSRQDAWTQARIIALAWLTDHEKRQARASRHD